MAETQVLSPLSQTVYYRGKPGLKEDTLVSVLAKDEKSRPHDVAGSPPNQANTIPGFVVPRTQSAVVTPKVGKELDLHVYTIPVKAPGPGEVVVRVAYTGICRSDNCFSTGPEPGFKSHNHIAGHESIGQVVQSHDPSLLGQLVCARYLASSCQACNYCLRGLPESCASQTNFPKHFDGGYQQYMTVPWKSLMLLPDWISLEKSIDPAAYTAALCSGSAALKAVRAADLRPGGVVVVSGVMGGIGHLAGMIAKKVYGAKVIGVDLARKKDAFGSDHQDIYDEYVAAPDAADKDDWQRFHSRLSVLCNQLRGSRDFVGLADAVIVTACSSAALSRLEEYICDGGSIICVGVPRGEARVSIAINVLVERQIKIQGTLMGGNDEAYQVLDYIRTGIIRPRMTHINLDDVGKSMRSLDRNEPSGKLVVRVNGPLI